MNRHLPCKHRIWDNSTSLKKILKTADDSVNGYTVDVDFEFPDHFYDKFEELPPAPESLAPQKEWFSDFKQEIGETSQVTSKPKYNGIDKLVHTSPQA